MNKSLQEIRAASLDKKSGNTDTFLVRILRPSGDYVTWLCLRLGLAPMHVTYFDLVLVLVSCLMFAFLDPSYRVLASIFLILWQLLDIVDGNMARVLGRCSDYGGFVDHICGIFLLAFLHVSIGIGIYFRPEHSVQALLGELGMDIHYLPVYTLILGAISSIAAILVRLFHMIVQDMFGGEMFQEYGIDYNQPKNVGLITRSIKFVRQFECLGGLQIIIVFLASLFGYVEIAIVLYFLLNVAMLGGYTGKALVSLRS